MVQATLRKTPARQSWALLIVMVAALGCPESSPSRDSELAEEAGMRLHARLEPGSVGALRSFLVSDARSDDHDEDDDGEHDDEYDETAEAIEHRPAVLDQGQMGA